MLEHVQKTLDELREHRDGVITYLQNIDNAIDVLRKMNVVTAEAERILKDAEPPSKPDSPNTSPTKAKLPKGIKRITHRTKPANFQVSIWDGSVGKSINVGRFDTLEQAVAARDQAVAAESAKEPTGGTSRSGTVFRCRRCQKEYKVKPKFCQTCAHKEFDGPIERTATK